MTNQETFWTGTAKTNTSASMKRLRRGLPVLGVLTFVGLILRKYWQDPSAGTDLLGWRLVLDIVVLIIIFYWTWRMDRYAGTLRYDVLSDGIRYSWNTWKPHQVTVPYTDITSVDLVGYDDSSYSTIFLGANRTYHIPKYDLNNKESRPQLSLERVIDGQHVYDLILGLWHSKQPRS